MRSWSRGWRRRCHPVFVASHGWSLRAAVLLLLLLLSFAGREARAEGTALAVHVIVDAPPSCTDEEKFWAEVARRTAEIHRAPAADDVPTLVVRARQEGERRARGELFFRTAEGTRAPRGVVARSCSEVTAALALAFVLAVEEGELAATRSPPSPPSPPPPSPLEPEPRPALRPTKSSQAIVRAPETSPAREVAQRGVATSMGVHGVVANVDGPALGMGIFSELRPSDPRGRVSLRLEAAAWRRTVSRDAGEAELTWMLLRARLCFVETAGAGGPIAVALCGVLDGGAFTASATQARNPLSYAGPWAGAGLAGGATWTVTDRLGFELEGGLLVPLVRDDLVLRPNAVLYSTPTLAMWLGIGPVLRF